MRFTLVINNSNVVNSNTNATYEYKFIGGGFSVPDGMEINNNGMYGKQCTNTLFNFQYY